MSAFREAYKAMLAQDLHICPKCGDADLAKAVPTLRPEPDGTFTCSTCRHHWRPEK